MSDNKNLELDITKLVGQVYLKVATWRNAEFSTNRQEEDALKIVSHAIVQDLVDEIFSQISVQTRTEVKRDETVVGSDQSKDTASFENVNPKDTFSKLFKK